MAEFMVTAASLASKAEELAGINNNFKGQIEKLCTEESALSGMWEGAARDAFHNAFEHDKNEMYEFYNAIVTYANALNEIAKKYAEAETRNVETATTRKY